jgi:hypothetical protein
MDHGTGRQMGSVDRLERLLDVVWEGCLYGSSSDGAEVYGCKAEGNGFRRAWGGWMDLGSGGVTWTWTLLAQTVSWFSGSIQQSYYATIPST